MARAGGRGRRRDFDRAGRQRRGDRARVGRRGRAVRRRHRPDLRARRARRLRARRRSRSTTRTSLRVSAAGRLRGALEGVDGRPRPRDARVPGGRRGRVRLRQQPPCAGAGGGRRERVRLPGLRARVHPAAVLRGPRAVPVGRAVGRPGGHPAHGPRDARAVPRRRGPPPLDRDGRGARSRSRACRPGSAGWATASGRRPASSSTGSWRRARSGRRSSSAATTSTRAPSPPRTARRRRWPTARDAVADWPLLNAMVNIAAGATWVSIHHGGGVGIGYSQHAGMVVRRGRDGARGAEARARPHDATRGWASCATWTRATSARSRSPASAASASRCWTGENDQTLGALPGLGVSGPATQGRRGRSVGRGTQRTRSQTRSCPNTRRCSSCPGSSTACRSRA